MSKKVVSVWTSIPFWRRSAAWVTGFASILLIWLTFDSMGQISMGTDADLKNGITKRVPGPTVINYNIDYNYYINECYKVTTPFDGGNPKLGKQLSLFD